jgi:hypothetical protein
MWGAEARLGDRVLFFRAWAPIASHLLILSTPIGRRCTKVKAWGQITPFISIKDSDAQAIGAITYTAMHPLGAL